MKNITFDRKNKAALVDGKVMFTWTTGSVSPQEFLETFGGDYFETYKEAIRDVVYSTHTDILTEEERKTIIEGIFAEFKYEIAERAYEQARKE